VQVFCSDRNVWKKIGVCLRGCRYGNKIYKYGTKLCIKGSQYVCSSRGNRWVKVGVCGPVGCRYKNKVYKHGSKICIKGTTYICAKNRWIRSSIPCGSTGPKAKGKNCHSLCLPIGVKMATQFYGPATPTYNQPNFCGKYTVALKKWFESTRPGGPTQPRICGPNWGAARGKWYQPNTLNISCRITKAADPQCLGRPRVHICLEYYCGPKP
jgi:hypothetical protein